MKRLIGFDLDGTLTQHRSPLDAEHRAILDAVGKKYKIIMVAAGNAPRVYGQMGQYPIDILANYGMQESRMIDGRFTIVRDDKAVQEMIRTQRPDGGWANDFLTRQNAAALRLCPGEKAQIAYRRAVRNLRLRHR